MAKEKHVEGEADHYIKTLIGAVLGYAADGLDMFLLSFILVFIIKDFGLTTAEAGNLTLATTIGMWIGSYIFGLLADKYGRTKILSFSIILFAVATFLMYFVDNYTVLLVLRFIIGLGIGGEFGIGMAIVTETWAPDMRARATSWVALGWQGGVLLAAVIPAIIVPMFGWRAVFLVGLVPALIAIYVRMHLKEPILWQRKKQRQQELIAKKENGTITEKEQKEYYYLADKIGRKKTFALWYIGGTIYCVIYFFFFTSQASLLWGSFLLGFTVNGMMGGYGAVIAENYPSEARSTAENIIFGTGRGLSGFGPAIIGYLATGGSLIGAMSLVFVIYPIALIFMWFTVPETKGIEID